MRISVNCVVAVGKKYEFVVIDKDSALTNGRYKMNLMSMRFLNVVNRCRYINIPFECNMDDSKELKDRKRMAK